MPDRTAQIMEMLKTKACLKQKIFRVAHQAFDELKTCCKTIAHDINKAMPKNIDELVRPEFQDMNEFEFRLKFSGDTLLFQMHSNIVTLPPEHAIFKNKYIQEDEGRAYFGGIRVYDFLSDSIKYNRYHDAGILMARLLVNKDRHYHIESGVEFKGLTPSIDKNKLSEKSMRFFVESAIINAIDIDLVAPSYQDIQVITLEEHTKNNMGEAGTKLGFQMSYDG